MVDSHENWTIGVSSDENFGIFKVPNMFLHIICLYCIGVHLSRTISGHPILLFLDVQLKLCPKLTCDQCHEKEYHMPCFIMPQHKFSDADGYPDRKVHNNGIRKNSSIYKMYELET